jgi:hypothetical protein
MPLNYLDLQNQVTNLGESTIRRRDELAERLKRCRALLDEHAGDLIRLQQLVEEAAAREHGLRCAVPLSERLDTHLPAKSEIADHILLAADGSQITPDPHAAVFYGLVNVGVFRMTTKVGETPEVRSWSELVFESDNPDDNEYISEDLVSLRRDARERQIMAGLAKDEPAPLLTLTDGPLELYHEPRGDKAFEVYFKQYLAALDDLALLNTITAGYVDRPRAALLTATLELLIKNEGKDSHVSPFKGVSDLMLMEELLKPGERSAVFALQFRSADSFEGRKALHFFYLNVGSDKSPSVARVEVPKWVVESTASMELLQSVLVEQARQAGGYPYPYALTRAHETAVVRMDEHEALERMIENELLARGLPPAVISQKLANKLVGKRTRY